MKSGFRIRDLHVLQTEVNLTMDFVGRRRRILGMISGGRESHIATSSSSLVNNDLETLAGKSDIVLCFLQTLQKHKTGKILLFIKCPTAQQENHYTQTLPTENPVKDIKNPQNLPEI